MNLGDLAQPPRTTLDKVATVVGMILGMVLLVLVVALAAALVVLTWRAIL